MMKQCESCLFRDYKDKLVGCAVHTLHFEWTKILKCIPFFGVEVKDYECPQYLTDEKDSVW